MPTMHIVGQSQFIAQRAEEATITTIQYAYQTLNVAVGFNFCQSQVETLTFP